MQNPTLLGFQSIVKKYVVKLASRSDDLTEMSVGKASIMVIFYGGRCLVLCMKAVFTRIKYSLLGVQKSWSGSFSRLFAKGRQQFNLRFRKQNMLY